MRDTIDCRVNLSGTVRAHAVRHVRFAEAVSGEHVPGSRLLPTTGAFGTVPWLWTPETPFLPNAVMYEWGAIVGNLLMRRGLNYGIGGMYIEYENVASPGDPVSPPDFTRDPADGVAYYAGLALSPDRDYLRVPLVAATLGSSDEERFPHGNLVTFFSQTSGAAGAHGKPFSDADNSVVFGGALVAFVDETDHTRDLLLSRFYLTAGNQPPKLATGQVGLEWRLTLN